MINPQSNEVTRGNGADEIRTGSAAGLEGLLPQSVRALVEQESRVRAFIQSHPLMVVLGALALGFSVARWMREE
jgi:hypothetical protein